MTEVTLQLHENYVQIAVRFIGATSLSYVEYGRFGAGACKMLTEKKTSDELRAEIDNYVSEKYDVRIPYLVGFKSYFMMRYTVNDNDVTEFSILESRLITPHRGGRAVSGGFKNPTFKNKIFNNLFNAILSKDVEKLSTIMTALDSIGD